MTTESPVSSCPGVPPLASWTSVTVGGVSTKIVTYAVAEVPTPLATVTLSQPAAALGVSVYVRPLPAPRCVAASP
jgi:hypothetical protein